MKRNFILISIFFISSSLLASDYVIYSITQDFPMGEPNEILKKDFYINIGSNQGIKKGTSLDVYRNILSVYSNKTKKIHKHRIRIGKVRIIHVDEQSSIAKKEFLFDTTRTPNLEFKDFMIGDHISISVK
ncbi:MAG: hypothetical protein OXB84_02825 [Halobacteriovoraceae bacterium]|nr:hypothetical protein [Halobacteriovoraceae bacterium]